MTRGGGGRGGRQGGNPSGNQRSTPPRRSARVNNPGSSHGVRGTEVTLCGMCSSSNMPIGNDGIGCDQCSLWFHPQCTGLPAAAIQCIQMDGGNAVRFVCCSCRCSSNSSRAGGNDNPNPPQDTSISQLFQVVKSLAETVANLANQVQSSLVAGGLGQNPRTSHSSPAITRENFFVEMREYEDRKRRRDCIIVRSSSARSQAEFVGEFSSVSQFLVGSPIPAESVHCINADTGMFRAKISNQESRKKLLDKAKNLKDSSQFSNIFISRDLTYLQRQEQRALRDAGRRRDTSNGVQPARESGRGTDASPSGGSQPDEETGAGTAAQPTGGGQPAQETGTGTVSQSPNL